MCTSLSIDPSKPGRPGQAPVASKTLRGFGVMALLIVSGMALAATADLSNGPVANTTATLVRPNVLLALDDSGSMAWDYLPDDADFNSGTGNGNEGVYGYRSAQCNGVRYNPATNYLLPVKADGTSYPNASTTSPLNDGYDSSNGTTPLLIRSSTTSNKVVGTGTLTFTVSSSLPSGLINQQIAIQYTGTGTPRYMIGTVTSASGTTLKVSVSSSVGNTTTSLSGWNISTGYYFAYSGTQKPVSFTYNTSGVIKTTVFYKECNSSIGSTPGGSVFSLVTLSSSSAETQNYANWYSYYRTRILMMRSATGLAFGQIDPTRFRVGFATIHDGMSSESSTFQHVRDFDYATTSPAYSQKTTFYSNLYNASPSGATPLRSALSRAGFYYAKKLSGQSYDPIQYSCQRNYTILSTDGYWNTGDETSSYTAKQLTGSSSVGNQDGPTTGTVRPMLDDVKSNGSTGGPGVSNSLADIAMYWYKTDLRTAALGNCAGSVVNQDVCTNNVRTTAKDNAQSQHMNTFTVGLGVAGTLIYRPDYDDPTVTSGDFYAIANGTKAWPDPQPAVTGGSTAIIERVDDLWHAAVNGRAKYYSASNPNDLATSLSSALSTIDIVTGSGAGVGASNLQPATGDNFLFLASYETNNWDGDLQMRTVDVATGAVSSTAQWKASTQVTAQTAAAADTRNIYFFDSTVPSTKLGSFRYSNLPATLKSSFNGRCGSPALLTQCALLSAADLANVTGDNLVNYLRGQGQYENAAGNASQIFRARVAATAAGTTRNVLGDMIDAVPVYAGKPSFKYLDTGYSAFTSTNAGRQKVVYVAANDGMLHAIDATTGSELWAYIPTAVIPNLYKLADFSYATTHQFFVDGTPTVADVFDGTNWRTILVGGLNKGGRAYYALDVTNPAAPIALWEFTDTDLGYTYGNPVVGKLKNGTWVVTFSSGYNNVSPGSGNGYLYVLNASTGIQVSKIPTYTSGSTPAGTATTPSNLGRINAWVDSDLDNTLKRIYGGDMLGNVWRFDIDDNIAPSGNEAVLLGQARTSTAAVQPITAAPQLTLVTYNGSNYPVVSVGTGRYLGSSDIGDTTLQTVYAFKDTLGTSGLGVLRSDTGMVAQTLADVSGVRTISPLAAVDWTAKDGWYVDFSLSSGERVNVDMQQQFNQLTVATNIPSDTPCTPGGSSWIYYFDVRSGGYLSTSPNQAVGHYLLNSLVVGITTIQINGNTKTIAVGSDGTVSPQSDPPQTGLGSTTRRTSWRELAN